MVNVKRSDKSAARSREIGARLKSIREDKVYVLCEACGHETVAKAPGPRTGCPKCGDPEIEVKDLSLDRVARELDPPVTFQTLAKWESGSLGITIDRVEQLAEIYRVKPAKIMGYK
jgi:transcriptional regulator with XRE-family HTH domain